MASTTAATSPFRVPPRPPLRHLWQVPTFLLGLIAIAAVFAVCPPWQLPHGAHPSPALAELRELLKQPDFDRDHALKLGAEAVHHAGAAEAPEAHFLLGSVYVTLAERAGPGKGQDEWREARVNLEQSRGDALPEEDRPHLDYRLAKAWAQTGAAPASVVAALEPAIDAGADDPADAARGYGLLAEAYLRLPKPDLAAALAATKKQIDQPVVSPELTPARLRLGELLARLDHADEAMEVLSNVKSPPEVAAKARRLRVNLLEQAERWDEAASLWREALDDSAAPPQDRPAVQYHLGLCRCNAGHKDDALGAWEECARGDGDEGAAAAVGVAEVRSRQRQFAPALAALGRAVRDVKGPGDWHNALVPLPRAREVFEGACKGMAAGGAFEASAKAAELYERLAVPGRAEELRAEAYVAAARAAQTKAQAAAEGEKRGLYAEAESLLSRAGEAYQKSADAQTDATERAERLWLAANRFYDGHDMQRAAPAFERFLKIAEQPNMLAARRFNARLNEAWYKGGVASRDSGRGDAAARLFDLAAKSLEANSRYVYLARYEFALTKRVPDGAGGWRWTDDAEAILEKNLTQLRNDSDRDDEAREKTLYALGDLYFDRREQRDSISRAIDTLKEALDAFPNNAQALGARYELAESYRLRADQRNLNMSQEHLTNDAQLEIQKKVGEDREKAIANYNDLAGALGTRPRRDESDERLLIYALSAAADSRYLAGGYEKSGEMYEELSRRLKDKKGFEFEYLSAQANLARAYMTVIKTYTPADADKAERARQKVRRAVVEVRAGTPRLDAEARQGFEKWLKAFDAPR